ncbi:hypothetical protein PIB30_008439 [Stylosanthes scabra]|uniref:Uncharacterized protein n=1 Tax=Stylosanthes scabra TaxID=79078 RepID=A0ABU6W6P8_9FABA|nr:hypothetical protein [Stylosanthes scabra]
MINASSGGALMNKTPEETWEMIETVADANQHFNTRAKNRGVHEVAPSESTMLATTLAELVAMVKEIKEGQQLQETRTIPAELPADLWGDVTGGFWGGFTGGF